MNKQFVIFALLGLSSVAFAQEESILFRGIPEDQVREARQAMNGATNQLQNNLLNALRSMANASQLAGTDVSRSAHLMIRGILTNSFQLAGVAAYMPRLIFLDGPSQFIETLRLVRRNQIRIPTDMNTSIDNLMAFATQFRDSGIPQNFDPLVTFFPNIFAGVGNFLTTLINSVFRFIAPIPNAPTFPTTALPSTAPPSTVAPPSSSQRY